MYKLSPTSASHLVLEPHLNFSAVQSLFRSIFIGQSNPNTFLFFFFLTEETEIRL